MGKQDIKSLPFDELACQLKEAGYPAFRARQIYQWLHQKLVSSWEEMTNLPKEMHTWLSDYYILTCLQPVEVLVSKADDTRKYLFELSDGHVIESVRMRYQHGISVCISSQVGCRMGCSFCASTLDGLSRNLNPSEMLDQIYRIQVLGKERVSNVVVMGSGEPMDNYENLVAFIRLLCDEKGLNISQRNITVSTCGLPEGIRRLSEEGLAVTLALSLHAPNDQVRGELMPVARSYSLDEVLDACRYYFAQTGRRLTFEYSLVQGVNDNSREARELADLIRDCHGHVNLIPVNPIRERSYKQSDRKAVLEFKKTLETNGINVTIRREMGRDIDGACGQLRRSYAEKAGGKEEEI